MRVSYNIPARATDELKALTTYLDTTQKSALDLLVTVSEQLGNDEFMTRIMRKSVENKVLKPKSFVVSAKFGQWMELNAKKLGVSKSELFSGLVKIAHALVVTRDQESYQKALDLLRNGLDEIENLRAEIRKVCDDDSLDFTLGMGLHYFDTAYDGLKTAIQEVKPYRVPGV